jgi:hypothetical protein
MRAVIPENAPIRSLPSEPKLVAFVTRRVVVLGNRGAWMAAA